MKKQEVLNYLGIEELPLPCATSTKKCAALVKRTTGLQDYVICKNGGVVVDKKGRASIVKIIEFYPVVKVKVEPVVIAPVVIKPEVIIPEQPSTEPIKPEVIIPEPVVTKKEKFNRFNTIEFLRLKGEKNLTRKKNEELKKLFDGYIK